MRRWGTFPRYSRAGGADNVSDTNGQSFRSIPVVKWHPRARVGIGHEKVELDRLTGCGKPLWAAALQFDRVRETRCGDAHAVPPLSQYHPFHNDPYGIPD